MSSFISKEALLSWLSRLMEDRDVVAPDRVDELTLFKKISQSFSQGIRLFLTKTFLGGGKLRRRCQRLTKAT